MVLEYTTRITVQQVMFQWARDSRKLPITGLLEKNCASSKLVSMKPWMVSLLLGVSIVLSSQLKILYDNQKKNHITRFPHIE